MDQLSFITLCRLLAASQVVLTFMALLRSPNPIQVRAVFLGLGIGVASYLILPVLAPDTNFAVLLVPNLFSNAIPMSLWVAGG